LSFKAFTLIELLLVVFIITIIATTGAISVTGFMTVGQLSTATSLTANAVRNAQRRAMNTTDQTWGVRLNQSAAVVFRGATYASRDQTRDITFNLDGASLSGVSEVVFANLTGLPSQTGTITIASGGQQNQIQINAKGTLTY
jgi:prepilin-type N-terminal cleavage/methylation domain-containing protein